MLKLENIRVQRSQRDILCIPALELQLDQLTVILGHNGSGKSTLLKLLARQLSPDAGALSYDDRLFSQIKQRELARKIAYLPQNLPAIAGLTVTELVRLGRFPWRGSFGRWRASDQEIISQAITDTQLAEYSNHQVDELSGGERQRAWIAMLLAQQSPLLLLDEPTSALDPAHQYELMQLLAHLNREQQRGIVVILHDINLALRYAQRIIALKQGQLIFDGTPEQLLTPQHLHQLYGVEMQIIEHPTLPTPIVAMS
ncbi:ABC transporter ATP-binding protein [Celerinatantimonas diazotrophica]|uniref:Iron complex transport system ATP-binding protein n=1 Tax=Celerinatantimonas diazotrophica TaxID=412034 RepID=A0A4R1J7Z2_9GAMM|nr:ABC transporter ATP-binding protein [Celerinatantimonas diazotrophica]TCK46675.1 iron complex transport system ATP-binding protein [Celerinatantimonas diazotrophica]CAG9295377.1 Iron(3+)-hydroxamate import ATP-binding protein FhuC [Celerinatantimonas diazotrophica]